MHHLIVKRTVGRPKGSRQIRSAASAIRAAKAEGKPMPLDFLLAVMNDESQSYRERVAAAIAAAPYVHPKLQSIAIRESNSEPLKVQTDISDALKAIAVMVRTRSSSGAYQQT